MPRTDTAQRLVLIEEALARLEAGQARLELALQTRVPPAEIRQAIEDAFETLGQIVQLREVYFNQVTEITAQGVDLDALTVTIDRLLQQLRSHVVIWRAGDAERRGTGEWQPGDAERRGMGWGDG